MTCYLEFVLRAINLHSRAKSVKEARDIVAVPELSQNRIMSRASAVVRTIPCLSATRSRSEREIRLFSFTSNLLKIFPKTCFWSEDRVPCLTLAISALRLFFFTCTFRFFDLFVLFSALAGRVPRVAAKSMSSSRCSTHRSGLEMPASSLGLAEKDGSSEPVLDRLVRFRLWPRPSGLVSSKSEDESDASLGDIPRSPDGALQARLGFLLRGV